MIQPIDELGALRERFGEGVELIFDGPADSCPICHFSVEQLELDLPGIDPLTCDTCGAVLAA